jgi:Nuclease-related domain
MSEIVHQTALAVGILATCFIGPLLAFVFLLVRKRRARALRRSPLTQDLLRSPGHTLRVQLGDATDDVMGTVFWMMVFPPVLLSLCLLQALLQSPNLALALAPLYAVVAVVYIGLTLRELLKSAAKIDNLQAGYDAELAVGQELDQLMRQGAVVFHDLPADNFNIDHVVIAKEGIFAIETKGFTKPKRDGGRGDATVTFDGKRLTFPTWSTSEPMEQAEKQAAWLSRWLSSAAGAPLQVLPVVALPGWFVELKGRGAVRVFNGKQLAGLLASRGSQPLTAQDVQRVVHQVEQRCRTVAPRYAGEKPKT